MVVFLSEKFLRSVDYNLFYSELYIDEPSLKNLKIMFFTSPVWVFILLLKNENINIILSYQYILITIKSPNIDSMTRDHYSY